MNKIGKRDADQLFKSLLLPIIQNHVEVFTTFESSFDSPLLKEELLSVAHHTAGLIMAHGFDLEGSQTENMTINRHFADEEEDTPKGMALLADRLNGSTVRRNVSFQIKTPRSQYLSSSRRNYSTKMRH